MRALIQRVSEASVTVEGEVVGQIGRGLLVFVAVVEGDDDAHCRRLVERVTHYRVFPDENGKMNRSLADIEGQLLVVSQFTLAADTRKGRRPSFSGAAEPSLGKRLYEQFVAESLQVLPGRVETGIFAADMQVRLINDGPVTFWLEA
ncbi:D-aminoacyl-tRNA deacylase [Marinobacteraceae bacterium S3BR75-40.1]